jgi:molybdopterin-guanine dinucleotide biosynthesis protein A
MANLRNPVSIAILAGGQSSRMGTNKALSVVGGKRIIDRIIERVRGLGSELLIIANLPEDYANLGLPIHADVIPGKGPLGGLYTAISTAQSEYVLAVSCDQPFLNARLLQYLIDQRHGWDVIVPLAADGYPQSMHAVYGKGCLPAIQNCLAADKLKMIGFFGDVRVRTVAGEEIERIDPARHSFINVNSPEDLQEAERIAAQDDASG